MGATRWRRDPRVASDPAALAADAERLLDALALPRGRRRGVLLVHDLAQATGVLAAAKEAGDDLVVAYGNDHVAGVRRDGSVTLVDAGTGGASGYEDIGSRGADADVHVPAYRLLQGGRAPASGRDDGPRHARTAARRWSTRPSR